MAFLPFLNEELGECVCSLDCGDDPNFSCEITFQYININSVQDDSFDFFIIKSNGIEKFIGNIDAKCKSYASPTGGGCGCAEIDTFEFTTTIVASDITIAEAPPGPITEIENPCGTLLNSCSIRWRSVRVADNGCGTFGIFSIFGPCGDNPDSGSIGGAGTIDLTEVCCPLENSP